MLQIQKVPDSNVKIPELTDECAQLYIIVFTFLFSSIISFNNGSYWKAFLYILYGISSFFMFQMFSFCSWYPWASWIVVGMIISASVIEIYSNTNEKNKDVV